jgi:hypothetical protein
VPGRLLACGGLRSTLGAGTNEDEIFVILPLGVAGVRELGAAALRHRDPERDDASPRRRLPDARKPVRKSAGGHLPDSGTGLTASVL